VERHVTFLLTWSPPTLQHNEQIHLSQMSLQNTNFKSIWPSSLYYMVSTSLVQMVQPMHGLHWPQ